MNMDNFPLPINNRPERLHLYEWMAEEEIYVEGKFKDVRREHDNSLSMRYDIDIFWVRQVVQYYDRARVYLSGALELRMSNRPEDAERAKSLEKMALQAIGKAMMTAKGFAESAIRVYGEMPRPGLSSGHIEVWHPKCCFCNKTIHLENEPWERAAGTLEYAHIACPV